MLREERYYRILALLDEYHTMTPEQLSGRLYVSLPTVYRDLREMVRRKLVWRSAGQVSRVSCDAATTPLGFREEVHGRAKAAVAAKAAALVEGGAIFLDASTTVSYMVPFLQPAASLTVVTNGLVTALSLLQAGVETICVGGRLADNSYAGVGGGTREVLQSLSLDAAFLSAYGVDERGYLVDPSEEETSLRRQVLRQAKKKVFLCDRSKFGRNSLFRLAHLSEMDYLVAEGCPAEWLHSARQVIVV